MGGIRKGHFGLLQPRQGSPLCAPSLSQGRCRPRRERMGDPLEPFLRPQRKKAQAIAQAENRETG